VATSSITSIMLSGAAVKPQPFVLERYFAEHEFSARYLLSSSDCDGLPMSEIVALADAESRSLWDTLSLGYTESPGHPLLRAEIARGYTGITAGQVLVGAPEELILVAMSCLLEPGDHVVCTFPAYQSLYELATAMGCDVSFWRPDEEQGWRFDPADLRRAVRPQTKLVVVNFPHNPTGYLTPRDDFAEIVAIVAELGIKLFSDEMYRGLELDSADRLPSACEKYDGAIALTGMSKVYGMAGVRIGWLTTRDADLCARMTAFKDYTTICSSAPSEVLTLIALRARETIVGAHVQRIERNLAALDAFIGRHGRLFSWVRPRAGTVGLLRLPSDVSAAQFAANVLAETGIMIVPSTVFAYGDHHLRVGFGRANLPEVLAVLDDYLEQEYR
jgi:aspartate/methionine/tyrosine aminotransferase